MKIYVYICTNQGCGNVEQTTQGYVASKQCPKCRCNMFREEREK